MTRFAPPLFALALAACSGAPGVSVAPDGAISRNTCNTLDWRAVGFNHGYRGLDPEASFTMMENRCAGHGFHADRAGYFEGHVAGAARAGG